MFSQAHRIALPVAAVVIVVDQLTKMWAQANLVEHVRQPFIGTLLQLHLLYNPGAAFSMFTNATWVFAIFSSVICVFIVLNAQKVHHRAWQVAVGGVLGGAAGNLIDRLTNPPGFGRGLVVDFLELPYWPVFNVADSSVVIAATTMVVLTLRGINYDSVSGSDAESGTASDE